MMCTSPRAQKPPCSSGQSCGWAASACRTYPCGQGLHPCVHHSYTPYTRCPAGMALLTKDGSIFNGGAIESCAYNPTINPLQAACITLAAKGKGPFSEVCLVACA